MKLPALVLFALLADLPLAGSVLTVTNLGDTGNPGDLRYVLASAASGDTIVFSVSGTITLNSPLDIASSVTIDGPGIAINGSVSGTIFDVTGSVSDTFAYLSLLNANTAITGTSGASVSILNSTISGGGNGLLNVNGAVTNSTFAGNSAAINGGTVSLLDSTISGGTVGTENTNLTIGNSIIYGNGTDVGTGIVVTDLGSNLIGNGSGFVNGVDGDLVGTNPDLGPLANSGGPTLTYALLAGSPAIAAGNIAIIPAGVDTDQRGSGYVRTENGTVDIGAFEYQTPEPGTCVLCLLGVAIGGLRLRKR